MYTSKIKNFKTEFFSRGLLSPLCNNKTVPWDQTLDCGFEILLTLPKEEYIEHIEISADGAAGIFAEIGGERCAYIKPGETQLNINRTFKTARLFVKTDFRDVTINSIELYSPMHTIFPEPYEYKKTVGILKKSDITGVCGAAAEYLSETGEISVSAEANVKIEESAYLAKEEFKISVKENGISATGGSKIACFWAADVISQLIEKEKINCCEIFDKPYMGFRAYHIGLPTRENIAFTKSYIKNVLLPMRYNMLILQVSGWMEYSSVPEINKSWRRACRAYESGESKNEPAHYGMHPTGEPLTKAEVKEIITYARSFGIEVIPEIQSLSHVQYLTGAFPEIAETEKKSFKNSEINTNETDERPADDAAHSFCPLCEKSYEVLFKAADEVIELFSPLRYVHMGHDEVYEIGICEKCRKEDPAKLYYDDIMRIHGYLSEKNIRMIIWSDMINPSSRYKTVSALKKLPRDIILMDFIWYFKFEKDIELPLVGEGYDVVLGNMYSSHFPRYEARRKNFIGAETSTWLNTEEKTLGDNGKFFDAVFNAEMMWSERYTSDMRAFYSLLAAKRLKKIRSAVRNEAPAKPKREILPDTCPGLNETKLVLGECGYKTALDRDGEIKIGTTAKSLVFVHAADAPEVNIAWKKPPKTGSYTVVYESGAKETIPVEYGSNIRAWDKAYAAPKPQQYYRHLGYIATYDYMPEKQGVTHCGEEYCIGAFEWKNPRENDKIISVIKEKSKDAYSNILLFKIKCLE